MAYDALDININWNSTVEAFGNFDSFRIYHMTLQQNNNVNISPLNSSVLHL